MITALGMMATWSCMLGDGSDACPPAAAIVAQEVYLKAHNAGNDRYAASLSLDGTTLVVGAPCEDSSEPGVGGVGDDDLGWESGAVYVFERADGDWVQTAYLKAQHPGWGHHFGPSGDQFGTSVAIDGDTLVVGAPYEDSAATGVDGDGEDDSATDAGAAYVFVRDAQGWTQQAYLKASNSGAGDLFGGSIALSGQTLVVGARGEDSAANVVDGDGLDDSLPGAGAAYVFVRRGTTWEQQAYLKPSQPGAGDGFGGRTGLGGPSVAIDGDSVVVAARAEDGSATGINGLHDDSAPDAGAAYVFVRTGATWTQQAYLKASNADADDQFGGSVAIQGQTIVVGAPQEQSAAQGVGGDPSDNSSDWTGAAYVFVRSGSSWQQQAYLKASNAEGGSWPLQLLPGDRFGESVALHGDRLWVGAPLEDSGATGVQADGTDNSVSRSGAVYVFSRHDASWSELAYVKASNTGHQDEFGSALALSHDIAVIGAPGEWSLASGVNADQLDDEGYYAGAAYGFLVAPTWTDEGSALAGSAGPPVLSGAGPLTAGSLNALRLRSAATEAPAALFVAASDAPSPFHGGTLVPGPLTTPPWPATTSAAGEIGWTFVMPPGVSPGATVWLQWAIVDAAAPAGVALSNALRGLTP